jgi:integrase
LLLARKSIPIFKRPNGCFYARWWDQPGTGGLRGHRIVLSLDTTDESVAMQRYPIVRNSRMSYNAFMATSPTGYGPSILPDELKNREDSIRAQDHWRDDVKEGVIYRDHETDRWKVDSKKADLQFKRSQCLQLCQELGIQTVSTPGNVIQNNFNKIKDFYEKSVPSLFLDAIQTTRNIEIWLKFLAEKNILDWLQIDEALMTAFYGWRRETPIKPASWGKRPGVKPSTRTVNRHIQFLKKSFDLAVDKQFMRSNPLKFWKAPVHHAPQQEALTRKELLQVLSDSAFDKDFLTNGSKDVKLGYCLRDLLVLLFVSSKRRGEIVKLRIENVNFTNHYVHYRENKNSSRGTAYVIDKAFYLTRGMVTLLKRVIGKRTEGLVFPSPWDRDEEFNPEKISADFSDVRQRIVPSKDVSLNNLRHTATSLMEEAGLSDDEIDAALGHHHIKTALRNYQDRSADAIARRLSKRTEEGVKVLCDAVKELL